jgi:uncharacterized repeat protein (TIGR03806 family)
MRCIRKTGSIPALALGVTSFAAASHAQVRIAADLSAIPPEPPVEQYAIVDAFPGVTFSSPLAIAAPPGDSNRLFVAERAGRVRVLTNLASVTSAGTFLDISSRVQDDGRELGFKGIAFHPGYATNGYLFVTYCHTNGRVRISRFTRNPTNELAADPDSEIVLIDLERDDLFHNVNHVTFGPDGYLYVGMGDEGQPGATNPNAQIITQDFWSAILRIDPDKRPGSLPPNPHPAIAGQTNYAIPPDNPFIGTTQFNGVAVNPAAVRTEFHSVGYRNPWQFSIDPPTGELWVGDVGDLLRESIRVMPPGANAGWPFVEGTRPGPKSPPPGFVYEPPVWEYPHDIGPFAGSAVIGGLVVRTTNYPELVGTYLCIDHISGHLWSIARNPHETNVTRIAGRDGIVQIGIDPSNGDVLLVNHNQGKIERLITVTNAPPFPEKLSDTGLFADLATLTPAAGVERYEVNLPFWSDHATKRRWFAISNLTDRFGWRRDGPWDTPVGAVWIKHFDLDLDRSNTNTRRRIETRLLVRTTNGAYGVSYRWNAAGTEAYLTPDMGDVLDLPVTNSGVPAMQRWRIPSRAECLACHRPDAGFVLGFDTRQLNRHGAIGGVSGNQIALLDAGGWFANAPDYARPLPRYLRPNETNYAIEARARSYLAVNCGYCHQGPGAVPGSAWDGRAHVLLEQAGMVRVPPLHNAGNTNYLLLAPGDPAHSVIHRRMAAASDFSRMPPIASSIVDEEGIQLIANWIGQLPAWQSYAEWRQNRFGSTNSLTGAPDADPDEDGSSNWAEYLAYTDPLNEADWWTGRIQADPLGVAVEAELFNRSVWVETSSDLVSWSRWAVSGNDGIPLASGRVLRLIATPGPTNAFFRFRIGDP